MNHLVIEAQRQEHWGEGHPTGLTTESTVGPVFLPLWQASGDGRVPYPLAVSITAATRLIDVELDNCCVVDVLGDWPDSSNNQHQESEDNVQHGSVALFNAGIDKG